MFGTEERARAGTLGKVVVGVGGRWGGGVTAGVSTQKDLHVVTKRRYLRRDLAKR